MVLIVKGPHVAKGDISIRWDALASGIALSTLNSVQAAGESSFAQSSFMVRVQTLAGRMSVDLHLVALV